MAELSMNETTTFRWSFEEDVANYAAAGIAAIGVWRQKLSDCGQAHAVELLARHRLKASHLLWAGGFTGSDGRSYRESVDDAIEALARRPPSSPRRWCCTAAPGPATPSAMPDDSFPRRSGSLPRWPPS